MVTLHTIAGGRAQKVFEQHFNEVLKNMADSRTSAQESREITLTFRMIPDEDRHQFQISIKGKTKLAGLKVNGSGTAYISENDGRLSAELEDPKQLKMGLELLKSQKEA